MQRRNYIRQIHISSKLDFSNMLKIQNVMGIDIFYRLLWTKLPFKMGSKDDDASYKCQ